MLWQVVVEATTTTDGRRQRGDRSRAAVLDHAVDIASLEGLDALSFGRLAAAAGLSKAGVQGLFATKAGLQLATVDHARTVFIDSVVTPARTSRAGLPRLRALAKRWVAYVEEPVFAGGCFRVANMSTFDSRSGPVADALARDRRDWLDELARQFRAAVEGGELGARDVDRAAFEMDAVLCATNTAIQLGDKKAVARARAIVDDMLAPAAR